MMRNGKARKQAGFSFVELLITVAVLVIVAAIALPNFLKGKKGVNQNLAKARLAEVALAQSTFRSTLRNNRYGALSELIETKPNGAPLLSLDLQPDGTAVVQENWVIAEIEDASDTTFGVALIGPRGTEKSPCRPTYCVFEDGVVRGSECDCDRSTPPIE